MDLLSFIKRNSGSNRPLVLTESLCQVLGVVSEIFGQTWHMPIVTELRPLLREKEPPSGEKLQRILSTLVRQAAQSRPGLDSQLLIQLNQILYQVPDRRFYNRKYQTVILPGDDQSLKVGWWVSATGEGRSHIMYVAGKNGWQCTEWDVSPECRADLGLLVKIGGEVLGFLGERSLLPEGSLFQAALEEHLAQRLRMREAAAQAARKLA